MSSQPESKSAPRRKLRTTTEPIVPDQAAIDAALNPPMVPAKSRSHASPAAITKEIAVIIRMVDLRPVLSVNRAANLSEVPPAPARIDLNLSVAEARTVRMIMDGFEANGTHCKSVAEAIRLLLRRIRMDFDAAVSEGGG